MSNQPPPVEPGFVRTCIDGRGLTDAQKQKVDQITAKLAAWICEESMKEETPADMEQFFVCLRHALGLALRANDEGLENIRGLVRNIMAVRKKL